MLSPKMVNKCFIVSLKIFTDLSNVNICIESQFRGLYSDTNIILNQMFLILQKVFVCLFILIFSYLFMKLLPNLNY